MHIQYIFICIWAKQNVQLMFIADNGFLQYFVRVSIKHNIMLAFPILSLLLNQVAIV